MAVIIADERKREIIPKRVEALLPYRIVDEIKRRFSHGRKIEEIRLRRDRAASVSIGGENVMLDTVLTSAEMESVLSEVSGHSLYAHSETINMGYVTLEGGVRVGICGRASTRDGRICGVYDVSSMSFRIPHRFFGVGEPVCRLLREMGKGTGLLVFSPPSGGKTTLLCSVAAKMSSGERPWRVSVIDTRGELSPSLESKDLCIDVLSGYPRVTGIEIATRTMGAELIVTDEIGDIEESRAMLAAQNSGVSFVASAHASDVASLLRRSGIRLLHDAHVFGAYVSIERRSGDFRYTFVRWDEADDILQNGGRGNASRLQHDACRDEKQSGRSAGEGGREP